MEYFLMRKDEVVTLCNMTSDGQMISWSDRFKNPELAPLENRTSKDYLRRWWANRQIPVQQGRIAEMIKEKKLVDTGHYLINNLGLSLTDYYWMKPVDSGLKWADVNLYENDFKDDLLQKSLVSRGPTKFKLTPNSSLRGELEKSWIIKDGERVLVKGNRSKLSSESLNEVIATELHQKQGYDNYTVYSLIKIKDKPYDYGCCARSFTSNKVEFVTAYSIITSEEKPDTVSNYEHLINVAGKHGIDMEQFRADLEYQIMTDYLLTNVDRHMENIGVLRDAETLEFIRMAPIFDTGRSLGVGGVVPYTEEEIDSIAVNSFEPYEKKLLALIKNTDHLDLQNILATDRIEELYRLDSQISDERISQILRLYEIKSRKLEKLIG